MSSSETEKTDKADKTEKTDKIEKIGLAAVTGESSDSADPSVPEGQSPETPAPSGPQRSTKRVHPIFLLVLLLALAGMGVALSNQFDRSAQLESHVAFLSGELDRAHDELAAHEQLMEGVRTAVADLSHRMSSLQTLVNEPPAPALEP